MKVTPLPEAERRPRHVAVGEFDGVHLGHREVVRGADTVLTFEPHPRAVVRPEAAPKLLTSLQVKLELLEALGVEETVIVTFDRAFAERSAASFIDDILVGALDARTVSVGANFRFGHKQEADTSLLVAHQGFDTRVAELVEVDGEIVSSSHIRGLLLAGEVEKAARFLGSAFRMRGVVAHGDKRGRELGYPTANLVPDAALILPGHGVYAARANGVPAAVNVGVRPTFGLGRAELVETYLIDWSGDLYDQVLEVEFVRRLRGEKAFASVDRLVEQMGRDVDEARATVTAA